VQVDAIISLVKYLATFRGCHLTAGLRIAKRECIHFSLHNNGITRDENGGAATNIRFKIFVCPSDVCKSKDCNKPIRRFSCNSIWCEIGTVALRED